MAQNKARRITNVLGAPLFVLVVMTGTIWAIYGGMLAFQMVCVFIAGASQGWLARGDLGRQFPIAPGQAMPAPGQGLPGARCGPEGWHTNEPSAARHAKNQAGNPG